MFAKESDMVMAAAKWMESNGMSVKSEFVTPWGICDLVGLSLDQRKVARRLQLEQTRAVSSITRAVVLLQIPDGKKRKSITIERLVQRCAPSIPEDVVSEETNRLISDRFVKRTRRGRLHKLNGWMPLQDRLVAIELKLSRIEEAMRQAMNNLGFTEESYVGLPAEVARRVAASASRWSDYLDAGVGLLSVARRGCEVLIPARTTQAWTDKAIQFYCVEKFWRTRSR